MTLRNLARRTITKLVATLPPDARRDVMTALVDGVTGWELFQAVGRRYDVDDIRVLGNCGLIQGSLADDKIIAGYAQHKSWALETSHYFAEAFKEQKVGTYIDIGANLGLTTIPIAAFPDIDCKAFEPDPDNYRHLSHNVAMHCRHNNVELFNAAVCDHTGVIDFELDVHNHGDHRIHAPGAPGRLDEHNRPVIKVKACRLDDVFDPTELKKPLMVKVDTQGAEGQIFAGGETLLTACKEICLEYWPYSMQRFGADIDRMVDFIKRTWTTGSMVAGDADQAPQHWQPIGEIAGQMHERWRLADAEPFSYHEIYLKC